MHAKKSRFVNMTRAAELAVVSAKHLFLFGISGALQLSGRMA